MNHLFALVLFVPCMNGSLQMRDKTVYPKLILNAMKKIRCFTFSFTL